MNNQPNWSKADRTTNNHSKPGDAPTNKGGSPNQTTYPQTSADHKRSAETSVAPAKHGDARANGTKYDFSDDAEKAWPPPGDAALTVDETRIYLLKQHNIYHKERYTQKLRTDHHKLEGRRVPRAGGGSELKISQASIDRYAHDLNKDRTAPQAAETPLDPTDKLFQDLREIAGTKPYGIIVESVAQATPVAPTETTLAAQRPEQPTPAANHQDNSQDAGETPKKETETPAAAPAGEYVTFLQEMFRYFKSEAENERKKKETTEKAREDDREQFNKDFQKAREDNQEQQNDLIDELTKTYNMIFALKESNRRLTAAYVEAKAKLPPGTELTAKIEEPDNPAQQQLIPTLKPTNVRFKDNSEHAP